MKSTTSILIRMTALVVFALGTMSALSSYYTLEGGVVKAACTRSGSASYLPDGTPACDCTSNSNGGNCSCIVTCPPGGDGGGFEIEQGGSF